MLNDCTVSVASPSRLIAKLKNRVVDAIALGELLIKDQLPHMIDEQARSCLPWRGQGMQGEKQGLLLK